MQKIPSPLLPNYTAHKVAHLDRSEIIKAYKSLLNFDVASFLPSQYFDAATGIYQCEGSGYRFIYPYELEGSAAFYDQFTKISSYYQGSRWEWKLLLNQINAGETVLEVGAGGLTFMELLKEKGVAVQGLEINPSSIEKAVKLGLDVYPETIETFSKTHAAAFDVVCHFHVLEHIAQVGSFISTCCDALKPGGRLMISVPNNDSFLRLDKYQAANLPPHHMGYWTETSLCNLAKGFPLTVSEVLLQPYSAEYSIWHYQCWYRGLAQSFGIAGKVFGKLARPLFNKYSSSSAAKLQGPNILVVFKKI